MIQQKFVQPKSSNRYTTTRLIHFVYKLQTDINKLAVGQIGKTNKPLLPAFHRQANLFLDEILNKLVINFTRIDDLSINSQRALKWLQWLSNEINLAQHIDTLSRLYEIDRNWKTGFLATKRTHLSLELEIYNIAPLFRTRIHRNLVVSTVNSGFCMAPEIVLDSLYKEITGKGSKLDRQLVKAYTNTEPFQNIYNTLWVRPRKANATSVGKYYDLNEILIKVIQLYYDNTIQKPDILWSIRPTYRVIGRYDPKADTIKISKTLDNIKVPPFVLEYVIYHELLHKKIGLKILNNRHYAHTTLFRKIEKQFPKINEAKAVLNSLSKRDIESI